MKDYAKPRIFVVDDDVSVANVVSDVLSNAGYEVFTFYEPLSAMRETRNTRPDVVVSDYAMPGMNGLEFTTWLHENCPNSKVVILTAEAAAVTERAVSGLIFTLLQKPIESEKLIDTVNQLQRQNAPSKR
jgi:DNA-binding NtrC family response regulator